jgi:hypothetical protein
LTSAMTAHKCLTSPAPPAQGPSSSGATTQVLKPKAASPTIP